MTANEVLESFLETNTHQGRRYSLQNLMDIPVNSKKIFMYHLAGRPYKARISSISDYDADWTVVKITCSKFHLNFGNAIDLVSILTTYSDASLDILECKRVGEHTIVIGMEFELPNDKVKHVKFVLEAGFSI